MSPSRMSLRGWALLIAYVAAIMSLFVTIRHAYLTYRP